MIKSPFDRERFIGYVSSISPTTAIVTFPKPRLLERFYYDGDSLQGGLVGNYVIIEGYGFGTLAKTTKVELPDKNKTYQSQASLKDSLSHATANVEFQLSFDAYDLESRGAGIEQYPEIGAKVYACQPDLLAKLIENFGRPKTDENPPDDLILLASLDSDNTKPITISANALLSRHCAVVGTTGSGKSYTLGKLIEEMCKKEKAKILLLDATGEFESLKAEAYTQRLIFGENGDTYLPYPELTESDLFALFRPAGQVQQPILQQAIRSLKLAKAAPDAGIVNNGTITKTGLSKQLYNELYNEHIEKVESNKADFDMSKLMQQIENECIWDTARGDSSKWGDRNEGTAGHCSSLIKRISNLRVNNDISKLFGFSPRSVNGFSKLFDSFNTFYEDSNKKLLVLDISKISSEADVKDIFSNAVGRFFLDGLRKQTEPFNGFKDKPLIFIIDEAHQIFETARVKDEWSNEFKLDAFEKLAKEARKFGLFLCLSTQRPADIPHGVLSQMGTFIAHRLINDRDIQAIKNSVQDSSLGILSFLPTFKRGQALLTGNEFPMPIIIQTNDITGTKPESNTPILFQQKSKVKDKTK